MLKSDAEFVSKASGSKEMCHVASLEGLCTM